MMAHTKDFYGLRTISSTNLRTASVATFEHDPNNSDRSS